MNLASGMLIMCCFLTWVVDILVHYFVKTLTLMICALFCSIFYFNKKFFLLGGKKVWTCHSHKTPAHATFCLSVRTSSCLECILLFLLHVNDLHPFKTRQIPLILQYISILSQPDEIPSWSGLSLRIRLVCKYMCTDLIWKPGPFFRKTELPPVLVRTGWYVPQTMFHPTRATGLHPCARGDNVR